MTECLEGEQAGRGLVDRDRIRGRLLLRCWRSGEGPGGVTV